jgi:surface antigen
VAQAQTQTVRILALAASAAALSACASSTKDFGHLTRHAPGANPRIDWSAPREQCVPFARRASGVSIRGDAHTWWDQGRKLYETDDEPRRGAVMVMRGRNNSSSRGHVAVVRKLLSDRQVAVDHANWSNKEEVQIDTPVLDVSEDNDWSRVRVWNVERGHFGSHVYSVQGFILPEKRDGGGFLW